MKKHYKIISIILTITLILSSVPLAAFAVEDSFYESAQISNEGVEKDSVAEILYEVENLRTQDKKVFRMSDGTFLAAIYNQPVHFLREGQWVDIDNTVTQGVDENGEAVLENAENSFKIKFANKAKDKKLVSLKKGTDKISWALVGSKKVAAKAENNDSEPQKATTLNKLNGVVTYENILLDTDLKYTLTPLKIKEDIIIKSVNAPDSFTFNYEFKNLTYKKTQENTVKLYDENSGETVFSIDAPFMYDAAGNTSSEISITVTESKKGFELTITPSKEWLSDEERNFPVVIDPTVITKQHSSAIKDTTGVNSVKTTTLENALEEDDNNLWLKVGKLYGVEAYSLIYIPVPSAIDDSSRIINASLNLCCYRASLITCPSDLTIAAYEIESDWNQNSITTNTVLYRDNLPQSSANAIDYITLNDVSNTVDGKVFSFNVTKAAQKWATGESVNRGIILKGLNLPSSEKYIRFYDSDNVLENSDPCFIYTYCDTKGVEDYWSYSNVELPKGGVASINQFTGYVSADIPLLSTESELLPYGLSLIYDGYSANTNTYSLSSCGLGMKLNIDQRIVPISTNANEYTAGYYYMYRNVHGTDIYLKRSTENSVNHDKDDLGYGYDATIVGTDWKLLDKKDNYVMFNLSGCITSMYSAETEATVNVTYDPGQQYRIHKITDGTGNTLTITRNSNWYVTSITDVYGRYVNFTYDSGNHLTKLTYYDGTTVSFTYDADGMLKTVSGTDNTGVKFTYYEQNPNNPEYYLNNRVDTVSETSEDVKTYYVFDELGRVISCFNDYGVDTREYASGETGNLKANQLKNTSSFAAPVYNMLKNHSFENDTTGWTAMTGVTADTDNKYMGYKGVKIVGTTTDYTRALQNVSITQSGEYTLSAYVKVTTPADSKKIDLIIYEAGEIFEITRIADTNGEWQRIELTANLNASKTHIIALGINGVAATAYFDCVQFEKASSANQYNMLENSSLSNTGEGWYTNSPSQVSSVTYTDSNPTRPDFITKGYRMNGSISNQSYVLQRVYINKPASQVAFELYGYSRADSAPHRPGLLYSLCLEMFLTDGTVERTFKLYNNISSAWQYATKACYVSDANKNKTISYVNACFMYYCNLNSADITGIGLSVDTTGKCYTYDDKGNLTEATSVYNGKVNTNVFNSANELTESSSSADGVWKYNYKTDNEHILDNVVQEDLDIKVKYTYNNSNMLTGTTLSSIKTGGTNKTISSSTQYTDDKNHIKSTTDAAGNTVNYTYDNMGRVSTVTSGNSKTTYTYYASTHRVQTVTSDTGADSSNAVTYTYDTMGKLTNITRGNTVYTIEYDEWGNQKAVKVGNTYLSTNTYETGNGNLKKNQYGNGNYIDFVYDKLDRLVSKEINGSEQFTQVYNNTGEIAKYNDKVTGVNWKYGYDLIGRLTDIFGSNGNRYYYTYDSENRIGGLKYIIGNATRSTNYTYKKLGIPNTTTFNNSVKTRVYDDLSRITSQKITTSSNIDITTSYTYKDIDTTKTTNIVNSVTNPFGTYNYTYDSMGNITGVTGAETKTYTYDYLGQLIGESGGGVDYTVTYDAFGNITNKNGKQYLYDTQNGWGDLLVSYDGDNITYDDIGNPIEYRNNIVFDWQKGRQLTSIGIRNTEETVNNLASFTYDSTGIRTSKTANGKTYHFTYVDGSLVNQTDGTNTWWFYYDSDGTIMAMEYNGAMYYYVTDGMGNIVGLVDASGNTVASYQYDAWGKILSATGTMAEINPIRYKGYYYDVETGLYYVSSRYYDPEIGRWINADALVDQSSVLGYNLFAYCRNNPVNMTDTTGNLPFFAITAAIGAVVGAVVGGVVAAKNGGNVWAGVGIGAAAGALIGTGAGMAAGAALAGSITATTGAVMAGGSTLVATVGTGGLGAGATYIANNLSQAANNLAPAAQTAASKMQEVATKGKAGEALSGLAKNTSHIPSLTGTASYRIPDGLDAGMRILSEVKNYSGTLSYTNQLKDFVMWSQANGYQMHLYTNATLTGPLQQVVDSGIIQLFPLG